MATKTSKLVGQIHPGDCIEGMKRLEDGSIDLVFADPPFNIGYEYDEYDDQLDDKKYLSWSRQWMKQVFRVLSPTGAFWLAIGDEYAAELKIEATKVGFEMRSWVIWYYTFGVHCKTKFTRSHAHLFHFVKDPSDFKFNRDAIVVPSARQLVYADKRANPSGRTPDDTWILRPQDCSDGFTTDEDTWYFPRVAGTFKERAGFHGCQMPEQLIGRIVKSCSDVDDLVMDPFSGSATTLAVAKKLGRRFVGFELSDEYVKLGTKRVDSIVEGDPLDGSEEPSISAPTTAGGRNSQPKRRKRDSQIGFEFLQPDDKEAALAEKAKSESESIIESFAKTCGGFTVDRVVADPELNAAFQTECDSLGVPGEAVHRNRFLFRLRKAGYLKRAGVAASERTSIEAEEMEPYLFASEIAWRLVSDCYVGLELDEILCDPRYATSLDELAASFAPGFTSLEYRWAALKLRKAIELGRKRAEQTKPKKLGIRKFKDSDAVPIDGLDWDAIDSGPGVYGLRNSEGKILYVGETLNLRARLSAQCSDEARALWPDSAGPKAGWEVLVLPTAGIIDLPMAGRCAMVKWYSPSWNPLAGI